MGFLQFDLPSQQQYRSLRRAAAREAKDKKLLQLHMENGQLRFERDQLAHELNSWRDWYYQGATVSVRAEAPEFHPYVDEFSHAGLASAESEKEGVLIADLPECNDDEIRDSHISGVDDSENDLDSMNALDELPDELPGAMGESDNDFDMPERVSCSKMPLPSRMAPAVTIGIEDDALAYAHEEYEAVLPIASVGCADEFPLRLQRSIFCARLPANPELLAAIMSGFDLGSFFRSEWMESEVSTCLLDDNGIARSGTLVKLLEERVMQMNWVLDATEKHNNLPPALRKLIKTAIDDTRGFLQDRPSPGEIEVRIQYVDGLMTKVTSKIDFGGAAHA